MNDAMKDFMSALQHPSARLTQHLKIWIGRLELDLDVLEFKVRAGFCRDYTVDVTVTSPRLDIDGKQCVGRRAGLQIDERAAVPSANYVPPADRPAATFNGVVTRWERIRASRDEAAYRLRIEPRFAALCQRMIRSDVFKDVTFEEMVTKLVIDRQNFDAFDVEFHLEGPQQKMEQAVMVEESVWHFIARHAKRKGIFWFYKQGRGRDGQLDTLVFANNPRAYVRSIEAPLLARSGLNSDWHEAVLEVSERRELVACTLELWERNYRTPEQALKATACVSDEPDDRSVFGEIARSTESHLTQAQGEALVQTRRDEQIARQATLSGRTDAKGVAPGVVMKLTNAKLASAEYGFVITSMKMSGSRTQPAHIRFKAMPAHLTYRPKFVYARDWRFLEGPVVGVVTTFDTAPYGCMDEHGRYPVLPKFLQGSGNTDKQLLKLRLLRPSSSHQGGFHSPLLPGTEVMLDAAHGDVDLMHIAGALHDYAHSDVVHGAEGMFSYAIWRSPLCGAEIVFNDLQGKESARIATVRDQSAVNLGQLLNSRKLPRGQGFEMTSQGWGTVRAAKGLFLSADAAAGVDTPHLEMQAAEAQLRASLAEAEVLRDMAERATAELAQVKDQQAQLQTAFEDLRKAVILLSAPEGIGMVSRKSIQLSSGESITATASESADFSIVKRFTVAVGDAISLFAQRMGIKIFAATGKVQIQAQGDEMELAAMRDVSITSSNGKVVIAADREILLTSGQGYIRIGGGDVEIGCPDAIKQKSALWSKAGPAEMKTDLKGFDKSEGPYNVQYKFSDEAGAAVDGLQHFFQMRSDFVRQAAGVAGTTASALSVKSEGTRTNLHYSSIRRNQESDNR